MELFTKKEECCGCSACAAACPVKAIEMKSDGRFFYPSVDEKKCVGCGKCAAVCGFKTPAKTLRESREAYAVKASDEVRKKSSSGGVFTLLSDAVLSSGGTVYGAAYDENMRVIHRKAENTAQRDKMRGSKYVRSDMRGVYDSIKKDLADGKTVLFTGTPCQTAAVKSFIGEHENLFTVDLICHGPASPVIWERFIGLLEKKYGKKVTDFSFRNKAVSWREYSPLVTFEDGSTVGANDLTGSFTEVFRYELCLAPSCTACPFASVQRAGDITIGDFWGVEKQLPELDDGAGVSAVLINTEKGKALFDPIKEKAAVYPCDPEQIAAGQVNMRKSSVLSPESERFYTLCEQNGMGKALAEYTRVGIKRRAKDRIKGLLKM